MEGQISIFEWMPEIIPEPPKIKQKDYGPEPEVGEYVTSHGMAIPHIMRPAYIGKKIVIDKSTQSHEWYQCGILEGYIPWENGFRSIVYTGQKQRSYVPHYRDMPGLSQQIYECLPWDAYPERMKAIYKDRYDGV